MDIAKEMIHQEANKQSWHKSVSKEFDALKLALTILVKDPNSRDDDVFFKNLIKLMRGDPNQEYVDPISLDVMRDPVVLSSGICVDKSSALD